MKASAASMALDNKTRSADPQIFLLEHFAGFHPIKIEHAARLQCNLTEAARSGDWATGESLLRLLTRG